MKLSEIDLQGMGQFREEPATFQTRRFHLPAPWDYVYTNRKVLLRLRHNGSGFMQIQPPSGPGLFQSERNQTVPMLMTWLVPFEGEARGNAFTNFWMPTAPTMHAGAEPQSYACTFSPEAADYELHHDSWIVHTRIFVPPDDPAMVMTVSITNTAARVRSCTVMPTLKPMLAQFVTAPWDVTHWYQTAAFCGVGEHSGIWMETRDPGGVLPNRLRAALVTDLGPTSFETCHDRFVGGGYWTSPQAVQEAKLALDCSRGPLPDYGTVNAKNATVGQPILAAMARDITLAPGEQFQFTLVLSHLPATDDGTLPPLSELVRMQKYFDSAQREAATVDVRQEHDRLFAIRSIRTPDEALNRYANEWLPLQLNWVMILDRGWPSGFRGTRDAAQDATGIIPLDAAAARERLLEIVPRQRSDGWFPRAFPVLSTQANDHVAGHVDGGVWVWELLYDYICYTRDFGILQIQAAWIDSSHRTSVLEHMHRLFQYFLAEENIGEHGLCKIREGDWNDAVNRAGILGRGESVMVTCQLVLALEQMAALLQCPQIGNPAAKQAAAYRAAAERFRHNLNEHAFNAAGFYNGVFNDIGKWVFSENDPDGQKRVNSPANSFTIIAGVAPKQDRATVFDALNSLKGPYGWRLYYPPTGNPPIDNLGRTGYGDLAHGIAENGTPYNHGSHGFFARACWTAGKGDLLYEVMRWMLPFYQDTHPVQVARTAPYGVVNHWKEAVGLEGVGGDTFLSGSITTALRNLYDGMLGFRPGLGNLVLDPVIPAAWDGLSGQVPFLGSRMQINIANPQHVQCGVRELLLDGQPAGQVHYCPRLQRPLASLPLAAIEPGRDHVIDLVMGPVGEQETPKPGQEPRQGELAFSQVSGWR